MVHDIMNMILEHPAPSAVSQQAHAHYDLVNHNTEPIAANMEEQSPLEAAFLEETGVEDMFTKAAKALNIDVNDENTNTALALRN